MTANYLNCWESVMSEQKSVLIVIEYNEMRETQIIAVTDTLTKAEVFKEKQQRKGIKGTYVTIEYWDVQ
jgi:hypothetical protein